MPAPRSAVLLRELAEIALRRAGLSADPDEALKAWRWGLTRPGTPGGAIQKEIDRAVIPEGVIED